MTRVIITLEIEGDEDAAVDIVDSILDAGILQDEIDHFDDERPLCVVSATCARAPAESAAWNVIGADEARCLGELLESVEPDRLVAVLSAPSLEAWEALDVEQQYHLAPAEPSSNEPVDEAKNLLGELDGRVEQVDQLGQAGPEGTRALGAGPVESSRARPRLDDMRTIEIDGARWVRVLGVDLEDGAEFRPFLWTRHFGGAAAGEPRIAGPWAEVRHDSTGTRLYDESPVWVRETPELAHTRGLLDAAALVLGVATQLEDDVADMSIADFACAVARGLVNRAGENGQRLLRVGAVIERDAHIGMRVGVIE